jgi:hypothetical protein
MVYTIEDDVREACINLVCRAIKSNANDVPITTETNVGSYAVISLNLGKLYEWLKTIDDSHYKKIIIDDVLLRATVSHGDFFYEMLEISR